MLTQTLTSLSLEAASGQEEQSRQSSIHLLYRNILTKMMTVPNFKRLNQLETRTQFTAQSIGNGKLITSKMRTKLIGWMEKLSLETFEFSIETLLLAIKILDQYLCLTNESPKALQLIGCACLFIAAKAKQVVIVAGQCYVIASADSFTHEQLLSKQMEIYKTLNYNTTFSSLTRVYKFITQNVQSKLNQDYYKKSEIENCFLEISKNLEFRQFRDHKIILMIIAMTETKKSLPSISQLLEMLKLYSVC